MLDKLIDYCESKREYEAGLAYGMRILHLDRARERTHRRLMRLYYLSCDRTAALRQYERCIAALEEELGVGPADSTVTLHEQIRADGLDDPELLEENTASEKTAASLHELLNHIEQLQATLKHTQYQIQQDLQSLGPACLGQQ
jgi:DNA-binding SARP family transcriptional activator